MHDYLFGSDVVRLAFVLGVVVSLLTYQRTHVTTGSIVVPGYIGLFILMPVTIAATFANAFVTYWFVNRVVRKRFLLYGRDKFTAQAMISIVIQVLMIKVSPSVPWLWESSVPLLVGVGYVVPALIAHDMARQGIKKTSLAVLGTGLIVSLALAVVSLVVPGVRAETKLEGYEVLSFAPTWVPVAVLIGALAAWALLKNHALRGGGFIGVAYLAAFGARPEQMIFLLFVALASWFVVTQWLSHRMILFGRRKFASMLIVSGLISWTALWIGSTFFGIEVTPYQNLAAVALAPVFVPGLLANDMERVGVGRTLAGSLWGAVFVLSSIRCAESVFDMGVIDPFPLLLAAGSGLALFKAQWSPWLQRRLLYLFPAFRRGRYASRGKLGVLSGAFVRNGEHLRPKKAVV